MRHFITTLPLFPYAKGEEERFFASSHLCFISQPSLAEENNLHIWVVGSILHTFSLNIPTYC